MAVTAIIYKTVMGVSQQYAEYFKTQLGADLIEASKATADKISRYSTVIICGGVFGGVWSCAGIVDKMRTVLTNKKTVAVFTVWDDSPDKISSEELRSKYLGKVVISLDLCIAVKGVIDKQKLSLMQKINLSGVKKKLMGKIEKDDTDFNIIGLIDGFNGGFVEADAKNAVDKINKIIN